MSFRGLKKESRILLHVRYDLIDFFAVIRGYEGIEHLKILRGGLMIRDLVSIIASENFFGEVKYLVTYSRDLSAGWREALKFVNREDIVVDPALPKDLEDLIFSYINIFSEIAVALRKIENRI
jgi:hypothetical protein